MRDFECIKSTCFFDLQLWIYSAIVCTRDPLKRTQSTFPYFQYYRKLQTEIRYERFIHTWDTYASHQQNSLMIHFHFQLWPDTVYIANSSELH